jgi:ribonuclease HI
VRLFSGLRLKAAAMVLTFGPRSAISITVAEVADLHNVRRLLMEGETVVVTWGTSHAANGKVYLEGVKDALELAKHQPKGEFGKNMIVYGDSEVITNWVLQNWPEDCKWEFSPDE